MTDLVWNTDLSKTLESRKGEFVLGRNIDGVIDFCLIQAQYVPNFVTNNPDKIFYEVVTDGTCFVHFTLVSDHDAEAMVKDLHEVLVDCLSADAPKIAEFVPQVSHAKLENSKNMARVVYREMALGSLGFHKELTESVMKFIRMHPKKYRTIQDGAIQLCIYEHGFCQQLLLGGST